MLAQMDETVMTTDAGEFSLRPMKAQDADAVLAFAQALPTHDLLFLPRDITQPKVMAAWVKAVEKGDMTTMLAWDEDQVIGCAAIFRPSRGPRDDRGLPGAHAPGRY